MSPSATTWSQIRAAFPEPWERLATVAEARYAEAIEADPARFREHATAFVQQLGAARGSLNRLAVGLRGRPETDPLVVKVRTLEERWNLLAAGFYADAQPARVVVGNPIVVGLVIGAVMVGVAAIAWSIAAYQYAVNLREQTALAEHDLQARVQASQEGRTLPPSTLPAPAESSWLPWMLGGGVVVSLAAWLLLRGDE